MLAINISSDTDGCIELMIRFNGTAPEPRKGIKSGHVPGSKCIPFGEV